MWKASSHQPDCRQAGGIGCILTVLRCSLALAGQQAFSTYVYFSTLGASWLSDDELRIVSSDAIKSTAKKIARVNAQVMLHFLTISTENKNPSILVNKKDVFRGAKFLFSSRYFIVFLALPEPGFLIFAFLFVIFFFFAIFHLFDSLKLMNLSLFIFFLNLSNLFEKAPIYSSTSSQACFLSSPHINFPFLHSW